jgi:glycosyltransferase involved in cell wall biosynthesis
MRKRIGIDFHVVDGLYQGSRTHVVELFSRVISISDDMDFFLFLDNTETLRKISPVFSQSNVQLVHMPRTNPIKRLCYQLPLMQRNFALDILHTAFIMPILSFSPCMVTIHDVLFESHPQYFTPFFRIRSRFLVKLSSHRAKHIFVVSEFSKQEISNRYRVPLDKITITYNAADSKRFFPGNNGKEKVLNRGLVPGKYILCVGRLEPRKNHLNLLQAFANSKSGSMPLVIVGQKDFGFEQVFSLVDKLNIQDRVVFIDDLTDDELPAFYRHAKLFVYISWAEGFGMPPLEAMASGVPVITSNTTAIPEVVGDAGIIICPEDIQSITEKMNRLLTDEILWNTCKQYGLKQAKKFEWLNSAKLVRKTYIDSFAKNSQRP